MVRAYFVYAFCPIYAWCNISTLYRSGYMSKDIAKLATFEIQKEFVCRTHLWNLKKEGEKG